LKDVERQSLSGDHPGGQGRAWRKGLLCRGPLLHAAHWTPVQKKREKWNCTSDISIVSIG